MRCSEVSTVRAGRRRRPGAGALGAGVAIALAALALTACGSKEDLASTGTSTTRPAASSSGTTSDTTRAGSGSTSTTVDRTSGTSPSGTSRPPLTEVEIGPNAELEVTDQAENVTWELNAVAFRGKDYTRVAYNCAAGGEPGSVWGAGTYTDDSSVCTAAVHAGLITFADGGRVVIEIRPALGHYAGTEAHGVTSEEYPAWDGSFVFPGTDPAN